jgi:hypothetical protein
MKHLLWGLILGWAIYQVHAWWTEEEPMPPKPSTVSRIIVGNGDGSETIVWERN